MANDSNDRSFDDDDLPFDEVIELLGQEIQRGTGPGAESTAAIIPAGHAAPTPSSLDDIAIAHAMDGDGTAMCNPHLRLDQVDNHHWNDVPVDQRCRHCAANLGV